MMTVFNYFKTYFRIYFIEFNIEFILFYKKSIIATTFNSNHFIIFFFH